MAEVRYAIAIHGGAGVINITDPEALQRTKEALKQCLIAGQSVLQAGGSAVDAVEAAVVALEADPHFNAGKGAVYTASGRHELEASIMTGDKRCGAATLLATVKHPIKLARLVMERTPHNFLGGPPAEAFAAEQGLELVPNSYFDTDVRYQQWQRCKAVEAAAQQQGSNAGAGHGPGSGSQHTSADAAGTAGSRHEATHHMQTVGAVAVDSEGRLAAATSTGGRSNKWDGRIGDTPINGAGNYACEHCAVSGTGMGEEFIRHVFAHDVAARMAHKGIPLAQAVAEVVDSVLRPDDGGAIAVDKEYNIVMRFNSVGMYRGCADYKGRFEVAIMRGEGEGGGPGPLVEGRSSEPSAAGFASHMLH